MQPDTGAGVQGQTQTGGQGDAGGGGNAGGGERGRGETPLTSPVADTRGEADSGAGNGAVLGAQGSAPVTASPEEQAAATGQSGSVLPFTGLPMAALAALGAAMLLAGVGMRRRVS